MMLCPPEFARPAEFAIRQQRVSAFIMLRTAEFAIRQRIVSAFIMQKIMNFLTKTTELQQFKFRTIQFTTAELQIHNPNSRITNSAVRQFGCTEL